ncbi:hypothetical protein QN277_018800 [Acacia crassicarpa]|uniref:Endonuclease/exonuclease/phosphatase domain-containing protein n=1 Tax=Acacia crassicarpa TaxID=499986 RepID=A0AAE1JRC1_9FABA|nr:hypothetical protein QN277_018800 [Acacia crassicarpa]
MVILAETKCESDSKLLCLKHLGFDGLVHVPSCGRSGGLVAVWKSDQLGVTVLRRDRQFLHFLCSIADSPSFFLTAVYSHPLPHLKHSLWEELRMLFQIIADPWIIAGDFNDIVHPSERVGGSAPNLSRINKFLDRINACHLTDAGFFGSRFTWRGPCIANASRLFERLDRAFINTPFLISFKGFRVRLLNRLKYSDHNLISLCFETVERSGNPVRPFCFEAMWLQHEGYNAFLAANWESQSDFNQALTSFQGSIVEWNREVFGMIENRKRRIMARLSSIQNASAYPFSRYLCSLEVELQNELQKILSLEEIKWFQKSRDIWILKGDRNIHGTIISRRK